MRAILQFVQNAREYVQESRRYHEPGDPPSAREVAELRKAVESLADAVQELVLRRDRSSSLPPSPRRRAR